MTLFLFDFRFGVLNQSEGLHDMGTVNWQVLLCLICAWVIVYVCVMKGIKSAGKVGLSASLFTTIKSFKGE